MIDSDCLPPSPLDPQEVRLARPEASASDPAPNRTHPTGGGVTGANCAALADALIASGSGRPIEFALVERSVA